MLTGYVKAELKVINIDNYLEYIEKVTRVIKKYGGEYLAREGVHHVVEGEDNFPIIIIIKFQAYKKTLEWCHSDEYEPVKEIRLQNSEGCNIVVKGL